MTLRTTTVASTCAALALAWVAGAQPALARWTFHDRHRRGRSQHHPAARGPRPAPPRLRGGERVRPLTSTSPEVTTPGRSRSLRRPGQRYLRGVEGAARLPHLQRRAPGRARVLLRGPRRHPTSGHTPGTRDHTPTCGPADSDPLRRQPPRERRLRLHLGAHLVRLSGVGPWRRARPETGAVTDPLRQRHRDELPAARRREQGRRDPGLAAQRRPPGERHGSWSRSGSSAAVACTWARSSRSTSARPRPRRVPPAQQPSLRPHDVNGDGRAGPAVLLPPGRHRHHVHRHPW